MGKGARIWLGPAIAVVVLAGLVLALRATGGKKPAASGKATPTIVNIKPSDVLRVTMTSGGNTLTLVRATPKGKKPSFTPDWRFGTASGPKAAGTSVQSLLFAVEPLTATRSVAITPAKAGLNPPAKTLALDLKNGSTTVVEVGARAPVGGYYARLGGASKVYLISGSLPGEINAARNAWLPAKPKPTAPSQKP